jgi:hypothetical protein
MSNGVSPGMAPGSKAGTDSQPSGHCQSAMAGGAGPVGTALFVLLVPSPTPLLIGSGSRGGSRSSPQPYDEEKADRHQTPARARHAPAGRCTTAPRHEPSNAYPKNIVRCLDTTLRNLALQIGRT